MTQEEIIQAISNDKMMPFIQPEQLSQIVEFVIKNYRLSLPSNLDEAADKYANKEFPDEPSCGQWGTGDYEPPVDMEYPREIAKDSFKDGAEWMAGQGASYNTKVGWIDGPTVLDWPDDILDKFEMGDEVIVQIRKK